MTIKYPWQAQCPAAITLLPVRFGVSNLEARIEDCLCYARKVAPAWHLGDYADKQRIQNLVFPDGVYYNREKTNVEPRINSAFDCMARLARVLQNKKTGNSTLESLVAGRVVWAGEMSKFFKGDLAAFEQLLANQKL